MSTAWRDRADALLSRHLVATGEEGWQGRVAAQCIDTTLSPLLQSPARRFPVPGTWGSIDATVTPASKRTPFPVVHVRVLDFPVRGDIGRIPDWTENMSHLHTIRSRRGAFFTNGQVGELPPCEVHVLHAPLPRICDLSFRFVGRVVLVVDKMVKSKSMRQWLKEVQKAGEVVVLFRPLKKEQRLSEGAMAQLLVGALRDCLDPADETLLRPPVTLVNVESWVLPSAEQGGSVEQAMRDALSQSGTGEIDEPFGVKLAKLQEYCETVGERQFELEYSV